VEAWDNSNKEIFKAILTASRVMLIVFWNTEGVFLIYFLKHGTTVNSNSYHAALAKLKQQIKRICPGLL
jgi:hypothetical protein